MSDCHHATPRDSYSSQTNGWSVEAERDIKDMRERVEGWYWLHTESMILYDRLRVVLVVLPAALNFISSFFNIRESELVPQVYVGLIELLAGLIVVVASLLKYGELNKSHKEASQKLANLRWQLDAELNKRHWEDRTPFQEFFSNISGDYADATFSNVESIPSRYKKRYLEQAPVNVYPEIILSGRRTDLDSSSTSDHSMEPNRRMSTPAETLKYKEFRTGVMEGAPSSLRRQAALQQLASFDAKLANRAPPRGSFITTPVAPAPLAAHHEYDPDQISVVVTPSRNTSRPPSPPLSLGSSPTTLPPGSEYSAGIVHLDRK